MPRHSQIMQQVATGVFFLEFPDQHFHLDLIMDSVYIAGTCRFRFYFFFHRDFAIPLTHPLFDPSTPYIVIPTIYGTPLSTSSSRNSSPSRTTGATTLAGPLYLPWWWRLPLGGYGLIFFILYTRRWLCPSKCQHDEWIPFFGIHLEELSSAADGGV